MFNEFAMFFSAILTIRREVQLKNISFISDIR